MMKKEAKKWFRLGWYQAGGLDEAWRIDKHFEEVYEVEVSR